MEKIIGLTPLRRFINLMQVDKQEIFSIYVYAIFNGIVTLSIPLGIQAIINFLTVGEVSTSWVVLVFFVIIGVALAGVMQIMQLAITENLQQKIFTRSAFEFAYRIPRLDMEALGKSYMPEMVNRFFDTLVLQKGLSKILIDFSRASLQIVFGLILLSLYHPFFVLYSLVLVIIVYLIFKFTTPRGLKTSLKESSSKYEVAHWLEELARTTSTFKLAGKTSLPLTKTNEKVAEYLTHRKAHFKTLLVQYINLVGFKILITLALLLIGGLLVINQQMNIGQFVAAEIIIILVLASVEKLILSMETIYDVLTAIEKIGAVTDIPLEEEKEDTVNLKKEKGIGVTIKNLSYRFEGSDKNILTDINFNVGSGNSICVSGYNGSGKSFLLQLIAGLFDSFSGSISYDGVSLKRISKEELRTYIGDSLTKEDVFKGTLLDNISLGKPDVSFEQVRHAAEIVGLTEFVESLSEGYHTTLISEGKNLPKSVLRKIVLARSIVGNPKLILLEDSLNPLSEEDKNRFMNYLFREDKNWTIIAISNDPAIARRFDRVVVLDKGKIIATDKLIRLKKESWYKYVFQTK